MQFSKTGNIYKVIRITGSQDNILGISFAENSPINNNIDVVEWSFDSDVKKQKQTSKEEILKQVKIGLQSINQSLETNYSLAKVYFSPFDSSECQIYSTLIKILIRHYHNGKKFKE
jgi:hypothetical protein